MSFQISIPPNRHVAARFIDNVRHALLRAALQSKVSQSQIARALGVHRSVIHRELKGYQDITVGRAAELAWAMGKKAVFSLEEQASHGSNVPEIRSSVAESSKKQVVLSPKKQYEEAA
jgi:IS30 family transposase